jgi:23S rRNA (uracil1939-C5)-methyltransferase
LPDDTFELTLDEMVHGGQALGRHAGRAIFVPYAIPGERIVARITEDRGRYAFAEVVRVLEPSPHRVTPRCPHFGPGRCGGCHFQHVEDAAQPAYKRDVVIDQFRRIGGFTDPLVHPTIPSPDAWAYRNHATFHVDEAGSLCYVGTDNVTLVPIEECHIIQPALLDLLNELDFDGVTGLDRVRLQVGSGGDQMVVLSTGDDDPPELEVTMPVSVNFLLSDNEPVNLVGSSHVSYTVRGRTFRVTAGGFFQVNLPQAEALVDLVLDELALSGHETVLDLYAGVGLFTAFLAERAGLVTSVESYPPELVERYDAAVLDPPRTGVERHALDALAALAPHTLIYVSCEPSTLARDAKRLVQKGYHLVDVTPVDMFPQTYHIECVAHFTHPAR